MSRPIMNAVKRAPACVCVGRLRCDCDFDMNLPDGKTCRDCAHARYCAELFGCNLDNERCDWAPSKFKEERKWR
jgi:hypothetical protein